MRVRIRSSACTLVALLVAIGCSPNGFRESPKDPIINPDSFFSDVTEGENLEAGLKASASNLQAIEGVSAEATLKSTAVSYANLFDAYSKDLRAAINAAYNGYVSASRRPGASAADSIEANRNYNDLVHFAVDLTGKLRGIQNLTDAYKLSPSKEGLIALGDQIKELLDASERKVPSTPSYESGIDKLRNDLLGGSEHPRSMWQFNEDASATIVVPIILSGDTRVTDNIDKTPFMERNRSVLFEILNVEASGREAFLANVKSDVPSNGDGDRQVDDSIRISHGATLLIERAEDKDRAYYLAWRGTTMTKEEFWRRFPHAEVRLTVLP